MLKKRKEQRDSKTNTTKRRSALTKSGDYTKALIFNNKYWFKFHLRKVGLRRFC
jgi:hypothetical protein